MTRAALCALLLLAGTSGAAPLLEDIAAEQNRTAAVVRDVAAATLLGDTAAASAGIEALPPRARRSLAPPLGVLAHVRPADDGRLAFVEDLLDDWNDSRSDRVRAHVVATDAAARAGALLGDERHDRWAAAVNDTVRPFGLGTNLLAVVNPILLAGSAVDSVLTAAAHVRHRTRASLREHEALAAYGAAADETPGGRLARDDARAARRLDRRVQENACRRLAERVEQTVDADRLDAAAYLLRSPAARGCGKALHGIRGDVADALAARRHVRDAARWPVSEPRLPRSAAEWRAYAAVATATVAGEPAAMMLAANRLRAGWPEGPNAPAARLVAASARALAGHVHEARAELQDVADDDQPGAAAARAWLAALPDADAEAVTAAERRHARDVAEYVLLGTGPSARGVLRTAAHTGAQGAAGLPALGITNAIGVLTRGFLAWRRDPASNETVITEGETYLARHPGADDTIEVRRRLVRAYERSERWDRALLHYQALPDPDPEKVRDLESEIADDMLRRAADEPSDASLLRAVVAQYPASKAADRAREIIAARDTGAGIPIPRDVLAETPDLLGATGLGLPAGLLDGDDANGELADEGIRVGSHAIEYTLRGDDEPITETIPIAADESPRVFATLAEIARRHRINHPEGEDDERGRWERWIPFFVQGTVGDGGVAVRPGIKLRPYEPAHPERYR